MAVPAAAAEPADPAPAGPPDAVVARPAADYMAVGDRVLPAATGVARRVAGEPLLVGVGRTVLHVYPAWAALLVVGAALLLGLTRSARVDGHLRGTVAAGDEELQFR